MAAHAEKVMPSSCQSMPVVDIPIADTDEVQTFTVDSARLAKRSNACVKAYRNAAVDR